MRIACCEDETAQARLIENLIAKWSRKSGKDCSIKLYGSAESFLFDHEEEKLYPYDLILLDISMGELDGYGLAERIRETDKTVKIAFLTADAGHVFDGYRLDIWRYILKPITEKRVFEMLDALPSAAEDNADAYVIFDAQGQSTKLKRDDILYAEVNGHYTTLHFDDQELTVKESFKEVLEKLNAASVLFVRCHRSAAVNVEKLTRIGRESCRIEEKIELPVSRGMYESLNRAFIEANRKAMGKL